MVVNYDATGSQKRAIAKLCIALGISEPIEDRLMTLGEAGRLIRELYARLRVREKPKLDVVVKFRRCKWCGSITRRARSGLCTKCGRFQ